MEQLTFENAYTLGNRVYENTQFKHIHYPEMLIRYDSNFIEFKIIPSLTEFKEAEKYLHDFHLKRGQKHVKFYFPENTKLTSKLLAYLKDKSYEIGFLELYAIYPECFPSVENNPDITIQAVTDKNLDSLLNLRYKHSLDFGLEFAKQTVELTKRQFENPAIQQILAFYKGEPAGYVDTILSDRTVEIDGLIVHESFQKMGIGSRLQKFVMESFPEKMILLIADGEDTPREMYQIQQYTFCGFKYEVQKLDEN